MALEKSRFARKKKPIPNQWKEIQISEEYLREALEYWMKYGPTVKMLKKTEVLERVIVSEHKDHTFSLSVAISKEGRSE